MTDAAPRDGSARAWLGLADEDLRAAAVLLAERTVGNHIACFHAQQAAEKALKSLLVAARYPIPKIHALDELSRRIPADRRPDLDPTTSRR